MLLNWKRCHQLQERELNDKTERENNSLVIQFLVCVCVTADRKKLIASTLLTFLVCTLHIVSPYTNRNTQLLSHFHTFLPLFSNAVWFQSGRLSHIINNSNPFLLFPSMSTQTVYQKAIETFKANMKSARNIKHMVQMPFE